MYIDDINYYNLSLEELRTFAIPIISEYMYSHLSDAIKKEIVNSIQKAVDIECKPFIRDEKIDKILE